MTRHVVLVGGVLSRKALLAMIAQLAALEVPALEEPRRYAPVAPPPFVRERGKAQWKQETRGRRFK